jgi:hypothetical protein
MRSFFIIVSIIVSTEILLGQEEIAPQDEQFNPNQLREQPLPFMDGSMIYEIITSGNVPLIPEEFRADSVQIIEKLGWKVQVFATKDFFEADSVFQWTKNQFPEQETEKVFNSPYYKIRVGNCTTRAGAEQLLDEAVQRNFRNAWIVKTTIHVREKTIQY